MSGKSANNSTKHQISINRPTLIIVYLICFLFLFIGGVISFVYNQSFIEGNAGQNSASYSYLGHKALATLLEKNNFKVHYNRTLLPRNTSIPIFFIAPAPQAAEKYLQHSFFNEIEDLLSGGATICYVCPKWDTSRDVKNPLWISQRHEKDINKLNEEFDSAFLNKVNIFRSQKDKITISDAEESYIIESNNAQLFEINNYNIEVYAENEDGALVIGSKIRNGYMYCISDPDIFSNNGLSLEDNGFFAFSFIQSLTSDKQIIIDEVCHGYGRDITLVEILLTPPWLYFTLHLLLCLGTYVYMSSRPFFSIQKEPVRERSKEEQVKSMGSLMFASRQHRFFLQKYFHAIIREIQDYFPMLKDLPLEEQLNHLDIIAEQKNIKWRIKRLHKELRAIHSGTSIQKVNQVFQKLYIWKESIIHGYDS